MIITGLGSEEDAVKAMKDGALDYVIKTQENSISASIRKGFKGNTPLPALQGFPSRGDNKGELII